VDEVEEVKERNRNTLPEMLARGARARYGAVFTKRRREQQRATRDAGIAIRQCRQQERGLERKPLVGIIMGSSSDWETMEHAAKTLTDLGVPHETRVVSAHRTPDLLFQYASEAEARGIEVVIAGAGGAAHLPGMTASKTVLPVLGVPVESKALKGLDSLLSIAQMPGGIPVGTLAIGKAGAVNAALLAAAILGVKHPKIREGLRKFREAQTAKVLASPNPASGAVIVASAEQQTEKQKQIPRAKTALGMTKVNQKPRLKRRA
jgi:5-(carboxyamino)imidazole ribonucleotide mutase